MHDPRIGRFFAVDPLAKYYPHNGPYNFSENRLVDCIELEGLEIIFVNGYQPAQYATLTNEEMYDYWNSKVNNEIIYQNYFNETDVRYEDGNLNSFGTPFSSVSSRVSNGISSVKNQLKSGELVLSNDKPITFVGHSQGNAHALGMIIGIRLYEHFYNKRLKSGEEKLHVDINFVMLSVYQGEDSFFTNFINSEFLDINSIQYTYENDLFEVRDVKGVTDANSEQSLYYVDGEKAGYMETHSATIDNKNAFEQIKKEDRSMKIFEKKSEDVQREASK